MLLWVLFLPHKAGMGSSQSLLGILRPNKLGSGVSLMLHLEVSLIRPLGRNRFGTSEHKFGVE